MLKYIYLSILIIFFFGCSATKEFVVSPNYSLSAFQYVYVYNVGRGDLYGLETKLSKMFETLGFKLINNNDLGRMSLEQRAQSLTCTFENYRGGRAGELSTGSQTVNIECFELINGDKVYSGYANFGYGMSNEGDADGALDAALTGFKSHYNGYDETNANTRLYKIRSKFIDWEKLDYDEMSLKRYYQENLGSLDPVEGIWTSIDVGSYYKIGIIQDEVNQGRDLVAIILETDNPFWEAQQVKFELDKTVYDNTYYMTYFMFDHSKQTVTASISKSGFLEMELRNVFDDSKSRVKFIKNYPSHTLIPSLQKPNSEAVVSGSGFFIHKSGLIVTNWHVIEKASVIQVFIPVANKLFDAEIILKDTKNDLAIISIRNFSFTEIYSQPIPFSFAKSQSLRKGQNVFTLGFPFGKLLGKNTKLSVGIINSLNGLDDDPRLIQISNPVQPGNSGGPLFNEEGNVIGIVVATLNAKFFYENASILPQNVNFAVKSDYLINLISMIPEEREIIYRSNKIIKLNLEDQVERINPFIVSIKTQ